jgi:hypothetical protein
MSAAIIGDSQSLKVMACRGICERHRASKPADIRLSRYMVGQKRCQACMMFIIWPGLRCPCCGYKLRTHPRNGMDRRSLRKLKATKVRARSEA